MSSSSAPRRIAISTGGGDAPGLNAVIRAVVLSALNRGWECVGIRDGYNGLLFSPHVAHLFDRGYVSFADDGGLIVSRYLNPRVLKAWHIAPATRVEAFRPEQNAYLDYHRREVFEKHDRGRRSKGEGG